MRSTAVRAMGQLSLVPPAVDRAPVRAKIAAEVARLDSAYAAGLDVEQARIEARGVLRAADANALSEDDWRAIELAYSGLS